MVQQVVRSSSSRWKTLKVIMEDEVALLGTTEIRTNSLGIILTRAIIQNLSLR